MEHHRRKTLGLFFSPFFQEYFALWPLPAPTPQNIQAAGGSTVNAVAKIQKVEEHVRDFFVDRMISVLITTIRDFTGGCTIGPDQSTVRTDRLHPPV